MSILGQNGIAGIFSNKFSIIIFLAHLVFSGFSYNCDQYKSSCNDYCGGSAMVQNFQCSTSNSGQSGTHSCVCKSLPDLFQNLQVCQNYGDQCTALCNKQASQTKKVTPQVTCEPEGMHSMKFSCECQIEDLSIPKNNIKCYNHLPESEGTCEDREFWGSCSEWWMRQKYFCAETCGFCEWGAKQDYDCYKEFQTCQKECGGSEDNVKEFACYTNLKKNDCICKQGIQKKLIPSPFPGAVYLPENECYDNLPSSEGTCRQRVEWGSCSEYWMQEKNYCARSCGYCVPTSQQQTPPAAIPTPVATPSTYVPPPPPPTPTPTPTPTPAPQQASLPTLMQDLSLQISPTPQPSPSPSPSASPITISVPAIVLPQQPNTPLNQVTNGVADDENGSVDVSVSVDSNGTPSTTLADIFDKYVGEDAFTGRASAINSISDGYDEVQKGYNADVTPAPQDNIAQISETVSTQQTPSPQVNTQDDGDMSQTWVLNHNKFRQLHCVPPMSWNEALSAAALSLSEQCQYAESQQYGQNFYRAQGYGSLDDVNDPIGYIVNYWYDQGVQNGFNLTNPQFLADAGTTTQVIWKDSVQVGCGWKECADNWLYVNCLYIQPGNIVAQFNSNIQPLC